MKTQKQQGGARARRSTGTGSQEERLVAAAQNRPRRAPLRLRDFGGRRVVRPQDPGPEGFHLDQRRGVSRPGGGKRGSLRQHEVRQRRTGGFPSRPAEGVGRIQ